MSLSEKLDLSVFKVICCVSTQQDVTGLFCWLLPYISLC